MLDVASYMVDPERRQRGGAPGERELLEAFLDFQRDTVIWKLGGLTREQLVAKHTPSGMSLLGLVKHLAYVERNWFQIRFQGLRLTVPWRSGDPGGDFRIEPDETCESVLEFYRREIDESRRIFAETSSLDALAQNADPPRTMRWIMIHMIEETARHCGHADFMREFTDGRTGE
jgi:uncharacterized damage-inducible protein DinB